MWAVGCGWPLRSAPWPQYGRGQRSSPQSLFGRKRPFLLNPVGSLTFLKGSFALHDLRGLGPAVTKLQQHLRYLLRVIPSCMAKRLVDLLISFLAEPDIFNAKALGFPCKRKGKRRRISSSAPFSRNCPEPKLTHLRGQNQRVLANVHSVLSQGAQDGVPVQNEGESQQRRKPIDILDIRDAQCTGIGNCCDVEKAFEKSTDQMRCCASLRSRILSGDPSVLPSCSPSLISMPARACLSAVDPVHLSQIQSITSVSPTKACVPTAARMVSSITSQSSTLRLQSRR